MILGAVVLVVIAGLVFWGRDRIHFDFGVFRAQLALADWRKIGIGLACIYVGYAFRAVRWALLVKHNKKMPVLSLLGTQVIGFTAVALIGRVADLVRPYLVAKRTGLPLSSQIAVYIVERLFDAGSMALIFSVAMFWIPTDAVINATAHSGPLAHLAVTHRDLAVLITRYGGLALTVLGALFLVVVRLAGGGITSFFERAHLSCVEKDRTRRRREDPQLPHRSRHHAQLRLISPWPRHRFRWACGCIIACGLLGIVCKALRSESSAGER